MALLFFNNKFCHHIRIKHIIKRSIYKGMTTKLLLYSLVIIFTIERLIT